MTWIPKPCAKPKRRKKAPKPLTRTKMRCGRKPMRRYNAKRKGSSFPKVKNKAYRDWVRLENPCVLAGRWTTRRLSTNDLAGVNAPSSPILNLLGGFWHRCWGDMTPAHIGEHQARGAPDVGRCVCMCQAAHQEYDEHRSRFYRVTHLTEKRLENIAGGLALRYYETGGRGRAA